VGFDAEWCVLSAADVGAPHLRERVWILGYSNSNSQSAIAKHDETSVMPTMGHTDDYGQVTTEVSGSAEQGGDDSKTWQIETGELAGSGEQYAELADTDRAQRKGNERPKRVKPKYSDIGSRSWWEAEPQLGRVADGVAYRSHRLTAIGNGQVPLCAATAFRLLKSRIGH
jgi:DNA (cytosine-5)-methyltransferase 1